MQKIFMTKSGKKLSKIGIGTYGIGGRAHRYVGQVDETSDAAYVGALVYQLNLGMNFTEISVALAQGKSAKLLAEAIKQSNFVKEDVFITHSIYPKDVNSLEDMTRDIKTAHQIFATDCFDSTLVPLSLIVKFGYAETMQVLHDLLNTGKSRYISLSNSNRAMIQKFHEEFRDRFFAHDVHLSFEIRENQDEGILDLCKSLGVRNNIWRPLRENKTAQHNWDLLVELSKKYGKTQNQIIINWLVSNNYFPMIFSKSIEHINENWQAVDFTMDVGDIERMNAYRVKNYNKPKVDWDKTGEGISVSVLPDRFEENLVNKEV